MFINMTIADAIDKEFGKKFIRVLCDMGINGDRVVLELNEKTHPDMLIAAKQSLRLLRMYGVSIALDDFGTHYSTLEFMSELPIDIVKVDKKFVQNAPYSKKNRSLLKFCVDVSHDLDCKVVAEGIETEEQLECAKDVGTDIGQGFLFSAPTTPQAQQTEAKASKPFIALEDFAHYMTQKHAEHSYCTI
jgi:EAL domain-containing protein (putative c-di-GMP-specific phosphodiesterase class I)